MQSSEPIPRLGNNCDTLLLNRMDRMRTAIAASSRPACTLLLATAALCAGAQSVPPPASTVSAQSAADLVRDVGFNETHDRERDSHWESQSARITPDQNTVRGQGET